MTCILHRRAGYVARFNGKVILWFWQCTHCGAIGHTR